MNIRRRSFRLVLRTSFHYCRGLRSNTDLDVDFFGSTDVTSLSAPLESVNCCRALYYGVQYIHTEYGVIGSAITTTVHGQKSLATPTVPTKYQENAYFIFAKINLIKLLKY